MENVYLGLLVFILALASRIAIILGRLFSEFRFLEKQNHLVPGQFWASWKSTVIELCILTMILSSCALVMVAVLLDSVTK